MKTIKTATLAILMTCAAMPAWGIDYASLAPLVPFVASAYLPFMRVTRVVQPQRINAPSTAPSTAQPTVPYTATKGQFIRFEERYAQGAVKVFLSTFGYVPSLDPNKYQIRIWVDENGVQGVILFTKRSTTEVFVNYLAVNKDAQRHGIGTKMLKALQDELAAGHPPSCLITLNSLTSALGFYRKFGFTCTDYICRKTIA